MKFIFKLFIYTIIIASILSIFISPEIAFWIGLFIGLIAAIPSDKSRELKDKALSESNNTKTEKDSGTALAPANQINQNQGNTSYNTQSQDKGNSQRKDYNTSNNIRDEKNYKTETEFFEYNGEKIIKLMSIKDVLNNERRIIQMLVYKEYVFAPWKWELSKIEAERIKRRLLQIPLPDRYDIQRIIESVRQQEKAIFISDTFLTKLDDYKVARLIKSVAENFVNENRKEIEFIEFINSNIPAEYLEKLSYLIKEFAKAIEPTKRQKIRGIERIEKYWNNYIYNIQLNEIDNELLLITSNLSNIEKVNLYSTSYYDIVGWRLDFMYKPVFFDMGLGENIVPKKFFPLGINPEFYFWLIPVFKNLKNI